MKPLITVIISTYKREKELERAIISVLNQTYKNFEILVIDDNGRGSKAQLITEKLLDKYISQFKNIKYITNEKNLGGALARNVGIENSEGEYIAFLDDDDEYFPLKLEKQIELYEKSKNDKLALVYCYTDSYDENNKKIAEYRHDFKGNCIYEAMLTCIASTSQWLCKATLLKNINGFDDVPSRQDSNLILKILLAGYEVDRVDQVLLKYNEHSNLRISNGGMKKIEGNIKYRNFCRKNYQLLQSSQILSVESSFSFIFSKLFLKNKMIKEAQVELKALWILNKMKWVKIQLFRCYLFTKNN